MGKQLLVVDDDPVVRLLLQECLSALGHQITAIGSAREGLEWLTSHTPDIVMVDMIMPEMSGLELMRRIRALPLKANIPFILLSANADRKLATLETDARPDRIIEKPWDMKTLAATIDELTGGNGSSR